MSDLLFDLKAFIDNSPTSWHAVEELGNRLALRDFTPLNEQETWNLKLGGRYFVVRGGSLCAFSLPKTPPSQILLVASHTDSPALKLKPQACFYKENMAMLGVETYGSPLLTSWMNRDLGIAGRVIISNAQEELEERLLFLNEIGLIIPQLAIHLDRESGEKGVLLNKQTHLCPLLGLINHPIPSDQIIERLVRNHLSFERLISSDLFLVPLEPARFVGYQNELLASYRIDNLVSAHATACAMAYIQNPSSTLLQMSVFFDHEEIGSSSYCGARSPFLTDLFERIRLALGLNGEAFAQVKHNSLCVSVDMAHAFSPSHPEKYDPQHQPLLGKGIVIKSHAHHRYASDATSSAPILEACRALQLSHQLFAIRSDMPCGSTVGPMLAEQLGMKTVDIGISQLSMHSIREVTSCSDYLDLCRLLTYLLQKGV